MTTETLHVLHAKHASRRNKMMVLLCTTTIAEAERAIETAQTLEDLPGLKAFHYSDVNMELWEQFKNTEDGTATDVFWEIHFHGQHEERALNPIAYLMA